MTLQPIRSAERHCFGGPEAGPRWVGSPVTNALGIRAHLAPSSSPAAPANNEARMAGTKLTT